MYIFKEKRCWHSEFYDYRFLVASALVCVVIMKSICIAFLNYTVFQIHSFHFNDWAKKYFLKESSINGWMIKFTINRNHWFFPINPSIKHDCVQQLYFSWLCLSLKNINIRTSFMFNRKQFSLFCEHTSPISKDVK